MTVPQQHGPGRGTSASVHCLSILESYSTGHGSLVDEQVRDPLDNASSVANEKMSCICASLGKDKKCLPNCEQARGGGDNAVLEQHPASPTLKGEGDDLFSEDEGGTELLHIPLLEFDPPEWNGEPECGDVPWSPLQVCMTESACLFSTGGRSS